MVFVKKLKFFILLFWDEMDQEKVFGEILETKEACWDYNNMGLKRTPKISILPKGLVQGFLSKTFNFFILFF